MDMDNSVGIDCGNGEQAGWRGSKGENWDNCNSINNKIFKLNKNIKKIMHEKAQHRACQVVSAQ